MYSWFLQLIFNSAGDLDCRNGLPFIFLLSSKIMYFCYLFEAVMYLSVPCDSIYVLSTGIKNYLYINVPIPCYDSVPLRSSIYIHSQLRWQIPINSRFLTSINSIADLITVTSITNAIITIGRLRNWLDHAKPFDKPCDINFSMFWLIFL